MAKFKKLGLFIVGLVAFAGQARLSSGLFGFGKKECSKDSKDCKSKKSYGRMGSSDGEFSRMMDKILRMCPRGHAEIEALSPTWAMLCSECCRGSDCTEVLRKYVNSDWQSKEDEARVLKSGKTHKGRKAKRAIAFLKVVKREIHLARLIKDLRAFPFDKIKKEEASKDAKTTTKTEVLTKNAKKKEVAKKDENKKAEKVKPTKKVTKEAQKKDEKKNKESKETKAKSKTEKKTRGKQSGKYGKKSGAEKPEVVTMDSLLDSF